MVDVAAMRFGAQQLREQLAVERLRAPPLAGAAALGTSALHDEIARLQEAGDLCSRRIEQEKRRIEELDTSLASMSTQVAEQRGRAGSAFSSETASRGIAILEARLEHAQRKHDEHLLANRKMREAIDGMRIERLGYERLAAKLQRELDEKHEELSAIAEAAQQANGLRERMSDELLTLRAQAEGDQAAFEMEWKELGKRIDADAMLKSISVQPERRADKGGSGAGGAGGASSAEKGRGGDGEAKPPSGWQGGKESRLGAAGERVESYADAFKRIQAATGVGEVEELVGAFLAAEDANLQLYRRVAELAEEVAKLDEGIAEVRSEVEQGRGQGQGAVPDSHRRKVQLDLARRLAAAEQAVALHEQRYQTAMRTLNALKGGVAVLFSRLGCDSAESAELLGPGGVTDANLTQHLGLIEQRTNELLQMYAAAQAHPQALAAGAEAEGASVLASALGAILGAGPHVPPDSAAAAIVPPSSTGLSELAADGGPELEGDEDYDEDEEPEDSRPFTRAELRARSLRGMARKERRAVQTQARSKERAEQTATLSQSKQQPKQPQPPAPARASELELQLVPVGSLDGNQVQSRPQPAQAVPD